MSARMDTCKGKGFGAIQPDNTDSQADSTGLKPTRAGWLRCNRRLANAAPP